MATALNTTTLNAAIDAATEYKLPVAAGGYTVASDQATIVIKAGKTLDCQNQLITWADGFGHDSCIELKGTLKNFRGNYDQVAVRGSFDTPICIDIVAYGAQVIGAILGFTSGATLNGFSTGIRYQPTANEVAKSTVIEDVSFTNANDCIVVGDDDTKHLLIIDGCYFDNHEIGVKIVPTTGVSPVTVIRGIFQGETTFGIDASAKDGPGVLAEGPFVKVNVESCYFEGLRGCQTLGATNDGWQNADIVIRGDSTRPEFFIGWNCWDALTATNYKIWIDSDLNLDLTVKPVTYDSNGTIVGNNFRSAQQLTIGFNYIVCMGRAYTKLDLNVVDLNHPTYMYWPIWYQNFDQSASWIRLRNTVEDVIYWPQLGLSNDIHELEYHYDYASGSGNLLNGIYSKSANAADGIGTRVNSALTVGITGFEPNVPVYDEWVGA